ERTHPKDAGRDGGGDDGGQDEGGAAIAPAVSESSTPAPPASSVPPTPLPSASVHEPKPSASVATEVRVRDKVVFVVRTGRGGRTAIERSRAANTALDAMLVHPDQAGEVRVEETQGTAVLYLGKTPFLTLGPEDVELSGEASLSVLAAQV